MTLCLLGGKQPDAWTEFTFQPQVLLITVNCFSSPVSPFKRTSSKSVGNLSHSGPGWGGAEQTAMKTVTALKELGITSSSV